MVVRITKREFVEDTVVQVDGLLQAADVEALRQECEAARGALTLELSQLLSADASGVETIHELVSNGAKLQGLSRYLELLLSTSRAMTRKC